MKILITSPFKTVVIKSDTLPRKGDKLDMFYTPLPIVKDVILFPKDETLLKCGVDEYTVNSGLIKAIVIVE